MSDFQYSTEQIAKAFNTTQLNIRQHKSRHKNELLKNIDYVTDSHTNYKVYWSKSGVIKLSDYIGTKEAKLFISQFINQTIKKPFKEIQTQITSQTPNYDNLSDNQMFGLMEMMLNSMRKQAEKVQQLETRIEEVSNQKTVLNVIEIKTAKEFKTVQKIKLDEIGSEINGLIQAKFIQQNLTHKTQAEITEIYKQAHRDARKAYYDITGTTYLGAKHSSFESKKEFLEWLKIVKV